MSLIRQVLGGGLRSALDQPPSRATAEAERLAMLATEYHLDRRVRSAHRGAEISTAAWQLGANTGNRDAADSGEAGREPRTTASGEAGREPRATASGEADEHTGSRAAAAPNPAAEQDAALGPPPLASLGPAKPRVRRHSLTGGRALWATRRPVVGK